MHLFGFFEMAERFIELGMMISFSEHVTFKKLTDIQEAAQNLPWTKILVETDAPYLAPTPSGRETKQPIPAMLWKIRELCGLTVEEVASDLQECRVVFGLD